MLLLFRRGGSGAAVAVAPTALPAGHGRAVERNGRIELFEDDKALEAFLAEQEAQTLARPIVVAVNKPAEVVTFNALDAMAELPARTEIRAPLAPLPNRRARRAALNDDEEAILVLLN